MQGEIFGFPPFFISGANVEFRWDREVRFFARTLEGSWV